MRRLIRRVDRCASGGAVPKSGLGARGSGLQVRLLAILGPEITSKIRTNKDLYEATDLFLKIPAELEDAALYEERQAAKKALKVGVTAMLLPSSHPRGEECTRVFASFFGGGCWSCWQV